MQEQLGAIVQADPAVDTIAMALGAGVGNAAQNNGRMFITLKPRDERDVNAFQVIARLRPKLAKVQGARLYLQAAQDVTVGARAARTQFQYTIQDADLDELNAWAPKILDKLKSLPELRDVASDQQVAGTTLQLTIDRDMASRFGIQPQLIDDTLYDAFGQRQVTQYFTQVNTYEVIEEVTPDAAGRSGDARQDLRHARRRPARWCRSAPSPNGRRIRSRRSRSATRASFPAITISFNLADGVALGHGDEGDPARRAASCNCRARSSTTFQGNAQAFQDSLSTRAAADPGGAGRRLPHPRRALRELHPSADDSLDAAVGRARRARRC